MIREYLLETRPYCRLTFIFSCRMPSMLRNNSRFRRDQRQLTEEEEMWFNEEDDFEDVPADSKLDSMGELSSLVTFATRLISAVSLGKMIDKKAEMMKSQSLQVTPAPQQPLLQTIVNSSVNTSHASSTSERKPSETVTSSMEDIGESDDASLAAESSVSSSEAAKALAAALGETEEEEHPAKEAEASTEAELPAEKETKESAETSDTCDKEKGETKKEDSEASHRSQEDSSNLKKVRSRRVGAIKW